MSPTSTAAAAPATPPRTSPLERIANAVLVGAAIVMAAVLGGWAVHRFVTPLSPAVVGLARPLMVLALGLIAVVEALRFGDWGASRAALFRWTRPVAGLAVAAGVIPLRLFAADNPPPDVMHYLGAAGAAVGIALLVDIARARRAAKLERGIATRLSLGATGVLVLAALLGADDYMSNSAWLGGFVVMLPLLVIGAAAGRRLQRAKAEAATDGRDA